MPLIDDPEYRAPEPPPDVAMTPVEIVRYLQQLGARPDLSFSERGALKLATRRMLLAGGETYGIDDWSAPTRYGLLEPSQYDERIYARSGWEHGYRFRPVWLEGDLGELVLVRFCICNRILEHSALRVGGEYPWVTYPQDIQVWVRNPTDHPIPMPKLRLVGVLTERRP